ncbi:MAG: YvrJ family protein [Clostridium sp.]|jgi:hypothetical protein|nr:YvrJ family protein [Clostridium sp.]
MEGLMEAAGNIGFPMMVSIYLLTRFEGKMESLTVSINQLSQALGQSPKP